MTLIAHASGLDFERDYESLVRRWFDDWFRQAVEASKLEFAKTQGKQNERLPRTRDQC
jgi:hypothetical protein